MVDNLRAFKVSDSNFNVASGVGMSARSSSKRVRMALAAWPEIRWLNTDVMNENQ